MEQSPILLTTPVRRPRLFCFSNPEQRGIFVLLKRCVTVLQRLNAIVGRCLLNQDCVVLCSRVLSLTLGLLLLLLICCIISSLLAGVCGRPLWVIPEAHLNVFRQLGEVDLRNTYTRNEHDAVRFDSPYCDVFIFFPVICFEVISADD